MPWIALIMMYLYGGIITAQLMASGFTPHETNPLTCFCTYWFPKNQRKIRLIALFIWLMVWGPIVGINGLLDYFIKPVISIVRAYRPS